MKTIGILGMLVGAVTFGGCGDETVTYSYFVVPVHIDRQSVDQDLLNLVAYCTAKATTPLGIEGNALPCVRGSIPYELGKFEYSTTLHSGAVTFDVVLEGINQNPLASGESMPTGIVPGKTVVVPPILVRAIPGAMREPPHVTEPVPSADAGRD